MRYYNIDRKIVIQSSTRTQDGSGQPVPTWSDLLTCYGEKDARVGSEQVQADQVTSQNIVNWVVRYDARITPKMRISYNAQYYNIVSVTELEGRNQYLLLKTTLRDNVGEF